MDDRVRDLMYRVKKTATAVGETAESAARYAGRRAGEMVDVTKLNMKIYDLKAEIEKKFFRPGPLKLYATNFDFGQKKPIFRIKKYE